MNGGYLALIGEKISSPDSDIKTVNLIGNLLPILVLLFWYYRTSNKVGKIISAVFAMIFMTAFLCFMSMGQNETNEPYWLRFLIIALVSGGILTLVTYLSCKRSARISI